MKPLMLALALLLGWPLAAGAQLPGVAPAPPHPAAAAAATVPPGPVLSPAQAQAVLDVLQNDARRAQFVNVLQSIAKVQAATAPKVGGIKLTPGSLGAELLAATSVALGRASTEAVRTARTLVHLPHVLNWVERTLDDPDSRTLLVQIGWKLVLIVAVAGGLQYAAARGLAHWRETLHRTGLQDAAATPPAFAAEPEPAPVLANAAAEAAALDSGAAAERPAKPSAWGLLRRIPYALLLLALRLAPTAAFGLAAYALLATPIGAEPQSRLALLGIVNAVLVFQLALAVVRMLLAPHATGLRLIHMSDASARYLVRWAARFLGVAISGYAIGQTGLLFGMDPIIHDTVIKLTALVIHGFAVVVVLQCRGKVARRIRPRDIAVADAAGGGTVRVPAHGAWAMVRRRIAAVWHVVALFYIVALWLIFAFEVHDGYALMWHYFIVAVAVISGARLLNILLLGALDRSLRLSPSTLDRFPGIDARAAHYHPALRLLVNAATGIAAGLIVLQLWGLPATGLLRHGTLGGRIVNALGRSGLIVLGAIVAWEALNAAVQRHLARLARQAQLARSARLRTLLPMLRTTLMVVIVALVVLMVLDQIGVNTAPLLAGAGVVGIAVGFGSQKLVQDVITGLFLLLENAMQVGDWVTLGGLAGTVENLSIRTIRLRALDGAVHLIPFSAVTTVTNNTRDYGYAVLDVTAGYNEEPDHIAAVLREVSEALRADPVWESALEGEIDIQGVDRFLDNAWVMRARIRTTPSRRLAVQREFNRRLKYRFDALAIESPFTSPRILSTNPPPPPDVSDAQASTHAVAAS